MIWILLVIFLLVWLVKNNSHDIPGPFCLPFFGSIFSMVTYDIQLLCYPYRVMHRMSKVYGNVMRVMLGDQEWFVLSGLTEIKQFAMKDESTSHLPSDTFNEMYSFDKPLGVIFPDGHLWREQRKFVIKTLKLLGMGKHSLEKHIAEETDQCCKYMEEVLKENDGVVRLDDFFDLPCLNVIWSLVNSTRFDYNDQHLKKMIELIDTFTMNSTVGPLVGIPYLKYVPPFSFIYNNIKFHMGKFKGHMSDLVHEQKKTFDEDNLRGYVDHFLEENKKGNETHYTDEQLIVTLIDFFTGGSGTMSKTLGFSLLFCLHHPEVKIRVQEEIDQVLGNREKVTLEDRELLPYTEATLMEVARFSSVLPIAPPRKCQGEITVGKYKIPQGGLVQMNLYSLHRNKEHWGDPDKFRPDRFLQNGKVCQDEWLQPFSYGKRKCLGESIARNTIFLMFSNLMKNFEFEASRSHPLPNEDPNGGLTIGPQMFKAKVKKRSI